MDLLWIASSLLSAMNLTIDPCTDFFQYACGNWNKIHPIPDDESAISTFSVMRNQTQVVLKGLLEDPLNSRDNDATRKAKLFYNSCTNLSDIRKEGDKPIRQIIAQLGGWPILSDNWTAPSFPVETLLGSIRSNYNQGCLFQDGVGPDDKNSSANILKIDQPVLGLPSRDYYLKNSSRGVVNAYHKYMTNVAKLLGANTATAAKELLEVIEFERILANASVPAQDRIDKSLIYKKITLRELSTLVPQIKWLEYFKMIFNIEINENENIVTYDLPYFVELGEILEKTERRTIHNYVIWRLVMSLSSFLIDDYQKERMQLQKILIGVLSQKQRWTQCVEWVDDLLGMAVGSLYVRDHFDPESKETALQMIQTIREAFSDLLVENEWMDDETKKVAREKANAINEKIGYPQMIMNETELCKEYELLNITEHEFLKNILNVWKFKAQKNSNKLRQPVDKNEWHFSPPTVNAAYNSGNNAIEIPAGVLQPLMYSKLSPKSLNYGGIGVVFGHEITHGFDDSGRQYDKDGNMKQWWNNATIRAFREKVQCIIDQYSRYKIMDGIDMYVNGKMTQGDNIADNGGLKQSFRAYKKWVSHHGEEAGLPGMNLTHDQLFFLNFAQTWCGSMRPEYALYISRSDSHAPGPTRVLGTLSNSHDFAKAYNCPEGSPMNPTDKCSVW